MSSIYDSNNFKLINSLSEQPLILGWFKNLEMLSKYERGLRAPFFYLKILIIKFE